MYEIFLYVLEEYEVWFVRDFFEFVAGDELYFDDYNEDQEEDFRYCDSDDGFRWLMGSYKYRLVRNIWFGIM